MSDDQQYRPANYKKNDCQQFFWEIKHLRFVLLLPKLIDRNFLFPHENHLP